MRVVLGLVVATQLFCLEALVCKDGEYQVGNECCPMCPSGFRVEKHCNTWTGTTCIPCIPQTFTAHLSGLMECLKCKVCDPVFSFVMKQNCSSTKNTVCGCVPNHYCSELKDDDCEACTEQPICKPGQRVKVRGTETQRRVCEDCPAQTFSPTGMLDVCQPWTNCTALGLVEKRAGTSTSNVECKKHLDTRLLIGLLVPAVCLGGVVMVFMWHRWKRKQGDRDPETPPKQEEVDHLSNNHGNENIPKSVEETTPCMEDHNQGARPSGSST
ncbi:tumor necrosis factor receptor superfamily member 14 [Ornithorhynchus anatinus]|uniref:TNF receptor superfamily member 14 n=1 Tax=Ornithorhynchus anatinus TaxID=9258 RepID=A0A6I8N2U7_ORNAN|nr:tumor necrosis factor receptor superfamily member 14 [Ornithorhynchus anatinus]